MRFFSAKFIILILLTIILAKQSFADEKVYTIRKKIQVKADRLLVDNTENVAEFLGEVKADYDDMIISADTLKIFYKKDISKKKNSVKETFGQNLIKEMSALGSIIIKTEKFTAFGDQAIYTPANDLFILSGNKCRVIENNNSIEGNKIILNVKTKNITVEGRGEKRVEAVYFPKE